MRVPWALHPEILAELEYPLARQVCTGEKTGGRFEIIKSVNAVFEEVGKPCFPLFCVTLLCELFLLCCFKGSEGQYIHVKVW